ncbi:tetratricopeptide repeat protein [Taklimakanibacter deserti]|uniref:tetratricopeptide repeat protein n=1 Tax=Taklimakanibacter deserti TaxID=2267839 RepID=UPI000E65E238
MTDYYDLGSYSRRISTSSAEAQAWFDRGLAWCYGYNHDEAVRCFEKAAKADPSCAMAWWGIAYAAGPNYNKQWKAFDTVDLERSLKTAYGATAEALKHAASASPVEKALIQPLALRYPLNDPGLVTPIWNDDYAAAMREVFEAHSRDLDVAALFAEAIMNRTPWQLWDIATGKPAEGADTLEAIDVLEKSMRLPGGDTHPGLLHMYVHLMEMSPTPERALKAGDRLRQAVPDAGHLLHMPTHIDVLCGDYQNVVEWNDRAIKADRKYLAKEGALNFYSLYRCHDFHFKIYGAMFMGRLAPALEAAEEMAATLTENLLTIEVPPMADWLESFVPMKLHVLIRFGKWQDIIAMKLPQNQALYCVTTAMIRYARAVAFAATGNVTAAEAEAKHFVAVAKVPPTRYLFNNTCLDILAIAAEMMKGEIAYRKGRHAEAFAHLRKSVELDDNLPYDEPWGWMQPTRHALGALLLEQGKVEEAEAIYRADLGLDSTLRRACQHPDNVWSLHGFHECLTKLGKTAEAALIKPRLDIAIARADVPVKASCFCRLKAVA